MKEEKKKLDPEIKKLILWRLDIVPTHFKLSIGGEGTFTIRELKEHVEKEDKIGLQVVDMQLNFIKAVSSGELTKLLAEI